MKTLYERAKEARLASGLPWFTGLYNLNVFVLRDKHIGMWGDLGLVAYEDEEGPKTFTLVVSSEAATAEWLRPTHPDGCIYIKNGFYRHGYRLGTHNGRPALRQVEPFDYVRWKPDGTVPDAERLLAKGFTFRAVRGTNWHNGTFAVEPARPGKGSTSGCVLTLRDVDHAKLLDLVHKQLVYQGTDAVSPDFRDMYDVLPRTP
jgi:hypothetical protein